MLAANAPMLKSEMPSAASDKRKQGVRWFFIKMFAKADGEDAVRAVKVSRPNRLFNGFRAPLALALLFTA